MNVQSSLQLLWLLLLCLGAALVALWLADIATGIKWLAVLMLVILSRRYFVQFVSLNHPNSIRVVRLLDDRWRIKTNKGWFRAWPEGEAVVTSFLIACRMKLESQRRPVYLILLPDSAEVRELHGLRLKLMLDSHHCFNPENSPE